MSIVSKLFVRAVIAAGFVVLLVHIVYFGTDDPARFIGYLILAAIASNVHNGGSGAGSGLSLSIVPVLLAMLELSSEEAVVIACVAALTHYLAGRWRQALTSEALFRIAIATIAVYWSTLAGNKFALLLPSSPQPVKLVATAVAFILLSVLPAALNSGMRERLPLRSQLKRYVRGLPLMSAGAALAGLIHAGSNVLGWQMSLLLLPIFYLFYRSYCLFLARLESEKRLVEETSALNLRTIETLALAVEAKDQTTGEHLHRVQVYAMEVGRDLGLDELQLKGLQTASLLHDIGKLAVPEHIISKPGKLTPEEFEKIKIHPVVGAEIIERVRFPYAVAPIVRSHHEKWDGSGYPSGLSGENIPIGARILSAVDCLDAMASDRPYRRAMPLDKAMSIITEQSGTSFDPKVVEVLQRRYVELEKMAKEQPVLDFKLSTEIKIDRGLAPGAGFEEARTTMKRSSAESPGRTAFQLMAVLRAEIHHVFSGPAASRAASLPEALAALALRLQSSVPHETFVIYIQQRDQLCPYFAAGENQTLFRSLQIPMGQGLSGWATENKKPILNGSPAVESAHLRDPNRVSFLQSALVVPLETTFHVLGALALYRDQRDSFSRDHLQALQAVSSQLAIAIEAWMRRDAVAVTEETALLPVPSARSVFESLEQNLNVYQQDGSPLSLMLCQLDGYAEMAAAMLPAECEGVLRTISSALRDACRETDAVAHTGGPEFILIVPSLRKDVVDARIKQLREAVSCAVRQLGLRHRLDLIVASVHVPEEGVEAEILMAQLDRKLQRLKAAPRTFVIREPLPIDPVPETFRLQWRTTVV